MGITEEEEEDETNEIRRQIHNYKLDCQTTHIKLKTLKSVVKVKMEVFYSVTNDTINFSSRQIQFILTV